MFIFFESRCLYDNQTACGLSKDNGSLLEIFQLLISVYDISSFKYNKQQKDIMYKNAEFHIIENFIGILLIRLAAQNLNRSMIGYNYSIDK